MPEAPAAKKTAGPSDDGSPAPKRAGQETIAKKRLLSRSTMPYYIAAAFAAGAMAWYFFLYVPAKLDYFVGVRLRALAVAANQIKAKAENLASALERVPAPCGAADRETDTPKYVDVLIPDIRLYRSADRPRPGLQLITRSTCPPSSGTATATSSEIESQRVSPQSAGKRALSAYVGWPELVSQAAELSRDDFEDLVLALPSGEVVWQREETTPRIGHLAQVLHTPAAERGWFSFRWQPSAELPKFDAPPLPKAVAAKMVSIGGRSRLLLVQTVTMSGEGVQVGGTAAAAPAPAADPNKPGTSTVPPQSGGVPAARTSATNQASATPPSTNQTPAIPPAAPTVGREQSLVVAGVVSQAELQREASSIPIPWVISLSVPVILLFLGLPLVKLATLTSRERFGFSDALFLLFAIVTVASLGAVIPLFATVVDDETDTALEQLAAKFEGRIVSEVREVMALATQLETAASTARKPRPCTVPLEEFGRQPQCDLWSVLDPTLPERGKLDVDVAIWLDADGAQQRKWSTKTQVTGRTEHRSLQHFRDLSVGRMLLLSDKPGTPPCFTYEVLRAPTTGELGTVIALPLLERRTQEGVPCAFAPAPDAPNPAYLVVNLRPLAALDAVVPPDFGFALISLDGRVLLHSQESRALVENFFEEVGESADVRRRAMSGHVGTWSGDYRGRLHRLHLRHLKDIQGAPWRIVTFRELGTPLAGVMVHQSGTFRLVFLNLLTLALLGVCVWLVWRWKHRDVRDLFNVPPPDHPRVLLLSVAFAVAALVLIIDPMALPVSPDTQYRMFRALPFLALIVSGAARLHYSSEGPAPRHHGTGGVGAWLTRAEPVLLVSLVAALPAAGFARIVDRVTAIDRNVSWLEQVQQRIAKRNERVFVRVNGPAYSDEGEHPTRAALLAGFANPANLEGYAYLDFLPDKVRTETGNSTSELAPEHGQDLVRFLLNWNPFPSRDSAGHPPVTARDGDFHLEPLRPGSPGLTLTPQAQNPPDSTAKRTAYSLPRAKFVFGVVLVLGAMAALYWSRARLVSYPPADSPSVARALRCGPDAGRHGVLVIGAPRSGKDNAVTAALEKERIPESARHRIRLLEVLADEKFVGAHRAVVRAIDHPYYLVPFAAPRRRIHIHISNLETHLVDPKRRGMALRLLEQMMTPDTPGISRALVVTTTVDPIAHFEELFDKERTGIYRDAIPEVELSRILLVLSHFHRAYEPTVTDDGSADPWLDYHSREWRRVLAWETRARCLQDVSEELTTLWAGKARVKHQDLERAVVMRASALYQLMWTSCTRREKLVLVQLAQEGFVTPQSGDVVAALMAKGLIVRRPGPALFNHTFRTFLRNIERSAVVEEWEHAEGQGVWLVAGRLVASTVVAGGLFFLMTQGYSVEALLPVVSGTGVFGVPLLRNLVARFTGGPSSSQPASA